MDSITRAGGHWQPVKDRAPELYAHGLRLHRQGGMVFVGDHLSGASKVKRGDITEFTAGTRRRLRAALLECSIPGASRYGITLTVPWQGSDFAPLMDEWRDCVHRFGVLFRRRYPHSALIYRVELQTRGAPHLHALVYLAKADDDDAAAAARSVGAVAPSLAAVCFGFEVRRMWSQSVPDLHHGSMAAFDRYGCKVEPIDCIGSLLRYIADHTSKRKQAQLGYTGKQWGIIGQSNLVRASAGTLPPPRDDYHWAVFLRMLRKVVRYRISDDRWHHPPPFGCIYRGRRTMLGDFFLSADQVLLMYSYAATVERPYSCAL